MTPSETPAPASVPAQAVSVRAHGGQVLVQGPDAMTLTLTPDEAEQVAERLAEAAEEARRASAGGAERRKPPFPPSDLVSPHGAG